MDSDALVLNPISELWKLFSEFNEAQICAGNLIFFYFSRSLLSKKIFFSASFENEDEQSWYIRTKENIKYPLYDEHGINAGIMLMNLTRFRKLRWQNEIIKIYDKYRKAAPL